MVKLIGHPNTHGHHINPHTCGSGHHRTCDGFSGGYDTYRCGCCCHDDDSELSDEDRVLIECMLRR